MQPLDDTRWRPPTPALHTLPDDVLSIIALELAALHPRGPPSAVFAALAQTCRALATALSLSPHVCNAVFRIQFDVSALERRVSIPLIPSIITSELQRRWRSLKRIRWAASAGASVWADLYPLDAIREDMWVAYVLLLENDGKNWEQLVGWAMLRAYVQAYVDWALTPACSAHDLPEETELASLGLWLLWFLSDHRNALREMHRHPHLQRLITPMAFSSYAYATACHPWHDFIPHHHPILSDTNDEALPVLPRPLTPRPKYHTFSTSFTSYLSQPIQIRAPLVSEAALNLYFVYTQPPLMTNDTSTNTFSQSDAPSDASSRRLWDSTRLDAGWTLLTTRWDAPLPRKMPKASTPRRFQYVPGSLTGIFEGIFTIPDLDTYLNVRDGKPPIPTYDRSINLSHVQAWRVEEHICMAPSSPPSPDAARLTHRPLYTGSSTKVQRASVPLRPGPPLRAHLPETFRYDRVRDGIQASAGESSAFYRTWHEGLEDVFWSREGGATSEDETDGSSDGDAEEHAPDIDDSYVELIVTAESIEPLQTSRNQSIMQPLSTTRGTIRLRDGLIVLHARPLVHSSGDWIYIGRLDPDGNVWTGRWRALQDDATSLVWEGVFRMERRTVLGA